MKVYLIGVGMGNPATLTGQALEAIGDSPVLVGAPRLLEPWGAEHDCVPLIAAADIAAYVDKAPRGPVGVLLSGDTGFYSGAKGLWPLLGNHEVITIPGISSLSYFCARLQTTWQDARLVSAHGRSHNAVGEIQRSAKVFALTGGGAPPPAGRSPPPGQPPPFPGSRRTPRCPWSPGSECDTAAAGPRSAPWRTAPACR